MFGKTHFWPIFDGFLVPKQPIFKAFCDFGGAKMACNGLKMGSFHLLGTQNALGSFWEKHIIHSFLTCFWSQNNPFSEHFVALEGPKWFAMGSKWAQFTCLGTPNGLGSFLEKHIFDPFLVAKQPIFKAFCGFGGAKMACTRLKKGSIHLFRHPKCSRIIFGKTHF